MSAQVYGAAAWNRARQQRAQRGRAPRLAIQRSIHLRQLASGAWSVAIGERRFGKWSAPQWLCRAGPFSDARAAALSAWRQHKLPLLWCYAGDRGMRPFYEGVNEPQAVTA